MGLLLIVLNRFVFGYIEAEGWLELFPKVSPAYWYPVPRLLDLFSLLMISLIGVTLVSKKDAWALLKTHPGWNLFLWGWMFGVLLVTNPVLPGKHPLIHLVILGVLILQTIRVFYLAVIKGKGPNWVKNLGLVLVSPLLLLFVLEGIAMVYPRSHQNMMTHASQIWHDNYWKLNEYGFRERTFAEEEDAVGHNLLVVGDSFTAGWGVKDPEDRFSNRLAAQLGTPTRVFNLGENGAGPRSELEAIQAFPMQVDEVVLCWYVNDIHEAAESVGVDFSAFTAETEIRMRQLTWEKRSYLANYLYWLFPHTELTLDYYSFLQAGFANPAVLQAHFEELKAIQTYCVANQIRLSVVLFPILKDVSGSEFALQPMRAYWELQGVPCLDLTPTFMGYTESELTVNANDTHPNEFANELVADTLAVFLRQ